MKESLIKPNFFILGAAKSGTSALSEYLRDHPNVFFSDPKEPWFFATDFKGRAVWSTEQYADLFSGVEEEQHTAIGEGSVVYLYSKTAVPAILSYQPDARFIVMLRNPIELVQSLHLESLKQGAEDIRSFSEAWRTEQERKAGKQIPWSCPDPKMLYYSEWGKLGTQLKRVYELAPKDRVKAILFDDFCRAPAECYREVLTFLNLPDDGRTDFPKVNEARTPRFLFLQNIAYETAALRRRMGIKSIPLASRIHHWMRNMNTQPTTKKEIKSELHDSLIETYRTEIMLLSELMERDLSHWLSPLEESHKL